MAETKKGLSRRTIAMFWTIGGLIGIFILLKYEQIALIYVLATLGLVSLLLIVAFADLEKVGQEKTGS